MAWMKRLRRHLHLRRILRERRIRYATARITHVDGLPVENIAEVNSIKEKRT